MQRLPLLITITFLITVTAIVVGRGFYFFTENIFGFTRQQNLGIAVGYGLTYVVGALASHPLTRRFMEKPTLWLMIGGLVVTGLIMTLASPIPAVVVPTFILSAAFVGGAWPIVESYISAGRTTEQTRTAVGWFNLGWAGAFPPAVACAGIVIATWEPGLFLLPTLAATAVLLLLIPLAKHPTHLPSDDPNRPSPLELQRLKWQLRSARALLLLSYALIFVLTPLWPDILQKRLGFTIAVSTVLASTVDIARLTAFGIMHLWGGWHNRRRWLLAAAIFMPIGFFMTVMAPVTAMVLGGALLFGLMHGIAYYASLHYAMVVENASVEAGSHHEALIGLSFALGPAVALIGHTAGNMAYGLVPLNIACIAAALLCLKAAQAAPPSSPPPTPPSDQPVQ